jgi:hypothetical protein
MQADGEERVHGAPGKQPVAREASKRRECAGSFRFARFATVFGRRIRDWESFFTANPKYSIPVAAK